jgi:hypothetical protein
MDFPTFFLSDGAKRTLPTTDQWPSSGPFPRGFEPFPGRRRRGGKQKAYVKMTKLTVRPEGANYQ